MILETPLQLSRRVLGAVGTRVSLHNCERIPPTSRILVVSNHRSLLDAPLLMAAMNRPVRFACHYYMSRVPLLREMVSAMGAFPLDAPRKRRRHFFQQSVELLQSRQIVGVFPEGAQPMVQVKAANQLSPFHRGFAHLALRAPVSDLAILPVAIASTEEGRHNLAPLRLFSLFDPSEPLFNCGGWHSAIVYRQVQILFGKPVWINEDLQKQYRGRHGGSLAKELTQTCWGQIAELLRQSHH
ncbi:1-acyl-sn-glycerol-3-phosphate acyltransferase [Synechococcus sp. Cruz-9H2]|uniref:lysophospholipid acyltransferase family protein n=1 Tax=unclassified Synechococcus TaxID=2626047 RepID=UPI0020CED03D|nr:MULTISPECIES: lysophospholipid acyltransferase family protein [unclassified Synechococcus]MCP9820964.1 1-acyl-sn-glycerol-3-phosphate acyltransferase [Synechococcus sp. Cruz-9H2]MCP9845199.1 1-acyl-sn-glycerol-3-phosphate acyltransferase [Synechococcus sp. Edmonson 11F2]MCP9857370.1 1-acyl-sn-glycerol-3-phosphate acyltransferase [Synechococcus sp. Cruz-9C9]MCP9864615.1 1-acyl-sn-glycerol-3-phosphate acyltransferase [Synechococcus sp. Cruz-7E5]MCP9871885.1 1-acyl-sn-glycerol-3-phosphate acyl